MRRRKRSALGSLQGRAEVRFRRNKQVADRLTYAKWRFHLRQMVADSLRSNEIKALLGLRPRRRTRGLGGAMARVRFRVFRTVCGGLIYAKRRFRLHDSQRRTDEFYGSKPITPSTKASSSLGGGLRPSWPSMSLLLISSKQVDFPQQPSSRRCS